MRRENGGGTGLVWVRVRPRCLVWIVEGVVADVVEVFGVDVFAFLCGAQLLAYCWSYVVFFTVAGRHGLQGWCAFVMRQVVSAHDVWRPDKRFRVEADVCFCLPAFDALFEVRVIQP